MFFTPVLVSQMLSALFVCGILGNSFVICTIVRQFCYSFRNVQQRYNDESGHILIYILTKSIADGTMLLCCPLIVHFILSGRWEHGSEVCVMYWLTEQACSKTCILLLACVAFDRYAWLRRRLQFACLFKVKSAICACVIANMISIVLVCPILPRVDAFEVMDEQNNDSRLEACLLDNHGIENIVKGYMIAWVILTFGLPVCVTFFCICNSLAFLYLNAQQANNLMGDARFRMERAIVRCLGGALALYLVCALPHWTMSLLASLSPLFEIPQTNEAFLMFILHLLPYINAAGTWMFSALINRSIFRYIRYQNEERAGEEVEEMVALETVMRQGGRTRSPEVSEELTSGLALGAEAGATSGAVMISGPDGGFQGAGALEHARVDEIVL